MPPRPAQELHDGQRAKIQSEKAHINNKIVAIKAGEVEKPRIDPRAVLPGYMLSLTGGYEYRTYWFEIFETVRKVLLVGVPSMFPDRGGSMQLFWGLLVCFTTFGAYMLYAPFVDHTNDKLAVLAQLQIFLTLLSSLALRMTPPDEFISSLVTVLLFVVPLSGIVLETPLLDTLGRLGGKLIGTIKLKPPAMKVKAQTSPNPMPMDGDLSAAAAVMGADLNA